MTILAREPGGAGEEGTNAGKPAKAAQATATRHATRHAREQGIKTADKRAGRRPLSSAQPTGVGLVSCAG
jgi:hypothetical protein